MSVVIRAFPLRAPVEDLRAFTGELAGARKAEADRFYTHYGISHESWHLQQTKAGPWVIALSVIDDPGKAAPEYAQSTQAFERWFKGQVRQITGIDPDTEPLGPPTEKVFAWSDPARPNAALA